MQRIFSVLRAGILKPNNPAGAINILPTIFNTFQNVIGRELLIPKTPILNLACGFKVMGRVRRRCASCYFVIRDGRRYVICPKHPRHKQMAMQPKPHNTWILTHASQSKVRPW